MSLYVPPVVEAREPDHIWIEPAVEALRGCVVEFVA